MYSEFIDLRNIFALGDTAVFEFTGMWKYRAVEGTNAFVVGLNSLIEIHTDPVDVFKIDAKTVIEFRGSIRNIACIGLETLFTLGESDGAKKGNQIQWRSHKDFMLLPCFLPQCRSCIEGSVQNTVGTDEHDNEIG